nr:hypothetical protein [Tanacetum cinerariifolium]
MATQQDIYAAGSENCPPMLNRENYVSWSSRLFRYAKSRPNRKLIHNSIINGPYVRRMIPESGDPNREVPVNKTFHVQTDDELTKNELKQIEADYQAIQTILLGLPEDIYAAVDSCKTAQEIWFRVQQMMKGSDIGIQEKKAKLFNEWEMFTSTDGESIESYYHSFLKLINDLKRNKHFPEKIASNLKFLNNLQPEWSRHVTIVHQTKDLHTTDYTQLYDFLKYNQKEVDDLKAERLAKTPDPLALIATSNNPYTFPIAQPGINMGQDRQMQMVGEDWVILLETAQSDQGERMLLIFRLTDLDEIQEVNANSILMANLQQASTLGTQTDKAPVYDLDGSAEEKNDKLERCYQKSIYQEQYLSKKINALHLSSGELDLLFEAMYDDYIGGQPSAALRIVSAAQAHPVRQTPTTSTSITDTAPTPTNSSSQATNFPVSSQDVDGLNSQQQHAQQQGNQAPIQPETVAKNIPNAMFDANSFVNPFANLSTSATESSSSQYVDPSNMHMFYQPYPHKFQWTKDHPLKQVIGEPSRPELTRNQLRSDGDMCMYALTVITMEPKNVKEAMTDPEWIESMQEELLQFKGLIMEAIRIFLAYAAHKSFTMFQMDVKLHSCMALYGLKQAPRAWYDELSTFLLHNHFFKGTIDPTLFIRRFLNDILVSNYVLEILKKYGMESCDPVGEMTFFLGLQVNQSPCGIFINQSKYVLEILKKYGMESCDPVGTPMEIKDKLDLDQNGTPVDATKYRSMIGALMYLTSSRPNIVHAICLCARYQAKPTEKHLKEVKMIFRYFWGTVNTGLWYTKDYGFEQTGFSDADYAGCKDTFKSTSGGAQFL